MPADHFPEGRFRLFAEAKIAVRNNVQEQEAVAHVAERNAGAQRKAHSASPIARAARGRQPRADLSVVGQARLELAEILVDGDAAGTEGFDARRAEIDDVVFAFHDALH